MSNSNFHLTHDRFWKKVTKISAQFKISSNASESLSQGIILVNICLWRSREQRFQPWPPPSQTGPPSQLKISSNASEYRASLSQVQEAGQGLGPACCTLYAAHCMLHTLCCTFYATHSTLHTLRCSLHAAHSMLLTSCCSQHAAKHCMLLILYCIALLYPVAGTTGSR